MSFSFVRYWSFLCLLFILLSCHAGAQNLIAYYAGNARQIRDYPVSGLSHIIFSFCQIRGTRLTVNSRSDSLAILIFVDLKKRNASLKILLHSADGEGARTVLTFLQQISGETNSWNQ